MTAKQAIKNTRKFTSFQTAQNFANRCEKLHMILMGDDNRFWVGLPRYTEFLNKLGYEYI